MLRPLNYLSKWNLSPQRFLTLVKLVGLQPITF